MNKITGIRRLLASALCITLLSSTINALPVSAEEVKTKKSTTEGVAAKLPTSWDLTDIYENLDVFVSEVEKRGYAGCLYNSKYYLDTVWTSDSKHPVWLAYYVSSPSWQGDFFMWQHGCTGRIDGINGDVDLDVWYVNKPFR